MPSALRRTASLHALCGSAAVLALAAAGLAGCAGTPPPVVLPADVPAAWGQAPVAAPGAAAPELRSWWKTLSDAQLDSLVDEAIRQNLDLARAGSQLRQARRLALRADTDYRPVASANVRTLQDVTATDAFLHASLDVTWELGLFGMREGAQQVAKAGLDTSEAALQAAHVSVVAEVVHQYLALRSAQCQAILIERLLALDGRAVELVAVRSRARLAQPGDDEEALARRAQTAAQLPVARHAAVQSAQALAVLVGRPQPDPAWMQPAPLPMLGAVAVTALPADLLRTRPDVRKAEAAVLQAAGEAGIARAELYPRIAFGASYLYAFNLTQNRRTSNTRQVPAIGPLIDLPLFDWGLRRARADAQGEALQASVLAYRQTVLQGVAEAETALSALARQGERLASLDDASAALRRRARNQRSLLANGLSSPYDQLAVDRAVLQAEADRNGVQSARALAFVDLYKALGGAPLPPQDEVVAQDRRP